MVLSSTYQSTDNPLLSTLYEPLSKHLISVLGAACNAGNWDLMRRMESSNPRFAHFFQGFENFNGLNFEHLGDLLD
jgi:hypothetical protein